MSASLRDAHGPSHGPAHGPVQGRKPRHDRRAPSPTIPSTSDALASPFVAVPVSLLNGAGEIAGVIGLVLLVYMMLGGTCAP